MTQLLQDKVALVTGAGSGIGRATAVAFAGRGARVAVADIETRGGEETVEIIRQAGGEAFFERTDVSRDSEVKALVEQTVATFGGLNYAFNNAGVTGRGGLIADASEEAWERVMEVNLKGIWLCLKYELKHMATHGGGGIVNTSSIGGIQGFSGNAAYIASKHAVIGLTKAAALEYAHLGVRVNTVCPGSIRTPLLEPLIAMNPDSLSHMTARIPLGRLGTPEDIAGAVVWLCTEAAYVNGHSLVVDGGYVCGDYPPPG